MPWDHAKTIPIWASDNPLCNCSINLGTFMDNILAGNDQSAWQPGWRSTLLLVGCQQQAELKVGHSFKMSRRHPDRNLVRYTVCT